MHCKNKFIKDKYARLDIYTSNSVYITMHFAQNRAINGCTYNIKIKEILKEKCT